MTLSVFPELDFPDEPFVCQIQWTEKKSYYGESPTSKPIFYKISLLQEGSTSPSYIRVVSLPFSPRIKPATDWKKKKTTTQKNIPPTQP